MTEYLNARYLFGFLCCILLAVHWHSSGRKAGLNKLGLCAKCGIDIRATQSIPVTASNQTFYYCQDCGTKVRKSDRLFLGASIVIATMIFVATILFHIL
jgi:hypothetical protein